MHSGAPAAPASSAPWTANALTATRKATPVTKPTTRTAIYDPETGKIACVLLQAAFRCDQSVCYLFDSRDWEVGLTPTLQRIEAPMEHWEALSKMTAEERVARWKAAEALT